jgi:hypothetical protein
MSYLFEKRISKSSHAPMRRLSVGKPLPGITWKSGVCSTYSFLPRRVLLTLSRMYSIGPSDASSSVVNRTRYVELEHIALS